MLIHSLICWLADQRIILNQLQLKCDPPIDDLDYRVRFCEKITYQADENYLQFDANYLNIHIKRDQKSWYEFIKNSPENLLIRFKILWHSAQSFANNCFLFLQVDGLN